MPDHQTKACEFWDGFEIDKVHGGFLTLNPANNDDVWSFYRPDIPGYQSVKAEWNRRTSGFSLAATLAASLMGAHR